VSLRFAKRVASAAPGLDRFAERVQPRVRNALVSRPWLHDALDGGWLGVPLHPVTTDVPVGAWSAALGLDVVSVLTRSHAIGDAADGALAVGIVGAVPAAVPGRRTEDCPVGDTWELLGQWSGITQAGARFGASTRSPAYVLK
jgi:hypothetical protein